jgi:2-octaprenyl-6-methoxyphenol hydroxylase
VVNKELDVLIIGGGLIGALLKILLSSLGFEVYLVEAKSLLTPRRTDFDARSLALSPASVTVLQMLGCWSSLKEDTCAIETIHVSEKERFGRACLRGTAEAPLGYVIDMNRLQTALYQRLDTQRLLSPAELVEYNAETRMATIRHQGVLHGLKTKCLVAADGANSLVRAACGLAAESKEYEQQALVATIGLSRTHQHVAYERFTPHGPLALLPMTGLRASLVWTLPPEQAEARINDGDEAFLKLLQREFGYRLGRFVRVGPRVVFPLRQVVMPQQVHGSVVFIGNAAHTLHPVAGQGFNLGVRDVAMLAQCLAEGGLTDVALKRYADNRHSDQRAMIHFTNGLVELFRCPIPGLATLRGMGLMVLDNSAFLKKVLSHYARGYSGVVADLVCGLPLRSEHASR